MARHPYTYAADLVRGFAGYNEKGTVLSRCQASQIRSGIAKAIGMDDAELAEKLSLYYQENEAEITAETWRNAADAMKFIKE